MDQTINPNLRILILGGMPDQSRKNVSQFPLLVVPKNPIKRAIKSRFFKYSKNTKFINPSILQAEADIVIVYDAGVTRNFLNAIDKRFPKSRLIFWYFNPVRLTFGISLIPPRYEKWTYSKSDAELYGMKQNSQLLNSFLYQTCLSVRKETKDPEFDAVFVGAEKHRYRFLKPFKEKMASVGLSTDLYLVKNRAFIPTSKRNRTPLNYHDYLCEEAKGKAIIDCCTSPSAGITLRPLEAILLKKKVITNCQELLSSELMKWGNIISMDAPASDLKNFLDKPFADTPDDVIEYFLFAPWFDRFFVDNKIQ